MHLLAHCPIKYAMKIKSVHEGNSTTKFMFIGEIFKVAKVWNEPHYPSAK